MPKKKKPKRRVITHSAVPKTSKQKIQDIKDFMAFLDAEEDRLIAKQAEQNG